MLTQGGLKMSSLLIPRLFHAWVVTSDDIGSFRIDQIYGISHIIEQGFQCG